MTQKLKRLAALYGRVEQIRSLQLRAASTAVAEVVRASREEAEIRRIQEMASRAALIVGDWEGRAVAGLSGEVSGIRQRLLEEVRATRETDREQARMVHHTSRIRMEQVGRIMERTSEREANEWERRAQGASDDRFLSRRAWLKGVADQMPDAGTSMKRG